MKSPFEKENEERREREKISENVIKRYGVNNVDEVFYVGSLDLIDDYCGKPIYTMSPKQIQELEAQEMADMGEAVNEESEFESSDISQEELDAANEIYQRLMAEAAADEAAKQAEIEALKQQVEKTSEISVYSSGSPSANYGSKPMSQDDSAAFDSIMNSNKSFSKSIEELIAENQ